MLKPAKETGRFWPTGRFSTAKYSFYSYAKIKEKLK